MCRDKDHGGRRCPHDSAVARRIRRRNALKKNEFKNDVVEKTEPQTLLIEEIVAPVEVDARTTAIISKVNELMSEYQKVTPKTPEENEVLKYHTTELSEDEVKSEALVVTIGNSIDELSKVYGAPSDEEWEDNLNSRQYAEDQYLVEQQEYCDKLNAILGVTRVSETSDFINDPDGGITSQRHYYRQEMNRLKSMNETSETNDFMKAFEEGSPASKRKDELLKVNAEEYKVLVEKRANAYRQALVAVGVEFAGTDELTAVNEVGVTGAKRVAEAATYYPKPWVENSNNHSSELKVKSSPVRAYYSSHGGRIVAHESAKESVYVHELAHRMEHTNIEIGQAERRFLNRRAGWLAHARGEQKKKPGIHTVYAGRSEWGYRDNFATAYIGKVYDYENQKTARDRKFRPDKGKNHYEILSMGMEATFFGEHGGGHGANGHKKDIEHIHFVLGILAATGVKK